MGRINQFSNNFTAGELSPRLYSRSDLSRYSNGLKTMENMISHPHGGATRRTGTRFVAPIKNQSEKCRLIDFQFSKTAEQSYMIEMSGGFFRFYKDGTQIRESGKTITGATQANPVVITTSGSHGYSNGDEVYINDVAGMTEINNQWFIVANVTATTFELTGEDGTSHTAYSSGGTSEKVVEIANPYSESDLFDIQYRQSADVLFLVHKDYAQRELTRTSDTAWALTTTTFVDGPYLTENTTSTTLGLSATSGSVTVTASSTTGINGGDGFQTTDVGRLIRWHDGTDFHYLTITARSSTTVVTATIENGPTAITTATVRWRLGAWSDTTGYPRTTTFYENRAVFGGTKEQPDTIWGSAVDGYQDFTPGTDDDDPYNFTLQSNLINEIRWMHPRGRLRVGTTGSEWAVFGDDNFAISPTNVRAEEESYAGSKLIMPVGAESATLFVQRTGRKMRELAYNFESDGLVPTDLTIMAEHIVPDGITQMAHAAEPDGLIWAVRQDGVLLSLTYSRSQDVVGWARHLLGGTSTVVESVGVIPTASQDRTWLAVKRTINGGTKRYIEYISDEFVNTNPEDAFFVDSGLTYANSPASDTISDLHHLEGESVTILVDGGTHPARTVTNGSITLNSSYTDVQVGLGYTSKLETLDYEGGLNLTGSASGSLARITQVNIRIFESIGMDVGTDSSDLQTIDFRQPDDPMDSGLPLYSGFKIIRPRAYWGNGARFIIHQTQPLPLTVLSIVSKVEVSDNA